jgi:hypothetical protein
MIHFSSLPDIVLLEIFSHLSCEDALYAFADLHDFHLVDLLQERGAYRHMCLSSQLSVRQFTLLKRIWRYDLVRSLVCKHLFSDFDYMACQVFPSLTEFRLLFVCCPSDSFTWFVIRHASTLTHFTLTANKESFSSKNYRKFMHAVLPHLNRLKVLETDKDCGRDVQVKYF